jgi:hypothetical protein
MTDNGAAFKFVQEMFFSAPAKIIILNYRAAYQFVVYVKNHVA